MATAIGICVYILSLAETPEAKNRLPVSGKFVPEKDSTGSYIIQVMYQDRGGNIIGPLTSSNSFLIRNPKIKAVHCDEQEGISKINDEAVRFTKPGGYISFMSIDLSYLATITFGVASGVSGKLELRRDSLSGPILGAAEFKPTHMRVKSNAARRTSPLEEVKMNLQPASGTHDLYFVYTGEVKAEAGLDLWYVIFD